MSELLQKLKFENKAYEICEKTKHLEYYKKEELRKIMEELTMMIKNAKPNTEMISELKTAGDRVLFEMLKREKWKIDYFNYIVLSSFVLGLSFGSLATKAFLDYDLQKFREYFQTINMER